MKKRCLGYDAISLLLCLMLWSCAASESRSDGGADSDVVSPVSEWPTFTGDCQASWEHSISAHNLEITNGRHSFMLKDTIPGTPGFRALLDLEFEPQDIGKPLSLDPNAEPRIRVSYHVINTLYSTSGAPGMVQGTVTVSRYQPPTVAEFFFDHATLVGGDAVYAGTFRCGINGTLRTTFAARALGARCQTDSDCGGAAEQRVCDNTTFVCASGCRSNDDCIYGKVCEHGSGNGACR